MRIGPGVVGVEGNRRLELGLSLRLPGLHLPENPQRKMSRRPVRNTSHIHRFPQ